MALCSPSPLLRELAFHGLAWVDLGRDPGTLANPAYQKWARRVLPPAASRALIDDASMITQAFAYDTQGALHLAPVLFQSMHGLKLYATRGPSLKGITEVDETYGAGLTRPSHALHWFSAALYRSAGAYTPYFDSSLKLQLLAHCERMEILLARARLVDPSLESKRVELSLALGQHGRAFGELLVVGVELIEPSEQADMRSVVQLLHESAVSAEVGASYLNAEWAALVGLSKRVRGTVFEDAHSEWLAELNLDAIIEGKRRDGTVSVELQERLATERHTRAQGLRET